MSYKRKLTGYQTSVEFYNLFFGGSRLSIREYLDNSYCDLIGEIDLNNDTFNVLFSVQNKYFVPVVDGTYRFLINFSSKEAVHPDDREKYLELMDPDKIMNRLHNAPHKNFDFIHIRFRGIHGEWKWVEHVCITGKENGLAPGHILFYIFDIDNVINREMNEVSEEKYFDNVGIDQLTTLYTDDHFFNKCNGILTTKNKNDYCLVAIDIEHFKLYDEWFGRDKGDFILAKIGTILNKYAETHNGVGGYFGQDDFAILIPYNMDVITSIYNDIRDSVVTYAISVGFMPAVGVALLKDSRDIKDAFDKATIAAFRAKTNIKERINMYDPQIQIQAEHEYHVLLDCLQAIQNNEITFYLQPQCRISTGKIVGAEALSRWIKPDGTIVSPNDFIPILEKYNFITDLDKYIWDKVCSYIRGLIDEGINPVPISVNVSQVDIFSIDILEFFQGLLKKYDLSPKNIKIEITESAYADTTDKIGNLVKSLREAGFVVLMDDFGSGYSSLNMLNNIHIDVIKLDANFLNMKGINVERGIHILESVVNMAKQISLPIVVEGVETKDQSDFLEKLGCRYVQGFYYYKPMPNEKFKELIKDESNVDKRGFVAKLNEQFRVREFMDSNIYSDSMLNHILGPAALYSWDGGEQVDIVRYNEQFYESVGAPDFQERLINIQTYMPKEDALKLYAALKEAKENKLNGSSTIIRFHRADNTLMTWIIRFYYLGLKEGEGLFYGSANNVTEITDLQQQMSIIAKNISTTIIFMRLYKNEWDYKVVAHGLAEATGMDTQTFEDGINSKSLYQFISQEDGKTLKKLANEAYLRNEGFDLTFVFNNPRGEGIKLYLKADPISGEQANNLRYILTLRQLND